METNKEQAIEIATAMGFHLDYDNWVNPRYGESWLRFQLKEELDEKDMRWIWWKEQTLTQNLTRGAALLFKAGQKEKLLQINRFTEL